LSWVRSSPDTVHFERPGGWHCITNLGTLPVELPPGELVLASDRIVGGALPQDTTAWVVTGSS
jgi:alpha-glucosidase